MAAEDEQIGLRCGCESQHRVVRGIAADRCRQRWRVNDLSQAPQLVKCPLGIGIGAGQDLLELRTVHDLSEFGQQARAADQAERTRADLLDQRMRFPAPKNKPDSSTLVSTTARSSPALGTNGFHLAVDLSHRHRLDPGFGHAVGDRQKRVGCSPAPDRIREQPFERLGCQEPRSAPSRRTARSAPSSRSLHTAYRVAKFSR
jgi:hypothetical protein